MSDFFIGDTSIVAAQQRAFHKLLAQRAAITGVRKPVMLSPHVKLLVNKIDSLFEKAALARSKKLRFYFLLLALFYVHRLLVAYHARSPEAARNKADYRARQSGAWRERGWVDGSSRRIDYGYRC